ncbi:FAD-binding oxidoreductase [Halomonas sp. MCCC 1A17488]|uniref:NAD(P)/FAD-dependent oxidoreductase n=1 Tax=unclassified Halomonas TaxID=2609666 RepID=UPI0018D23B7F|nr:MULTISPECIES: FAD-binding oxidoreductase [unclassified Halomonas]MCE8015243.1 FAD-binding oxidoreductase [Halomonas sp. MCCC 1A17488]MCG3238576.1 FAD-binding oxidoreductase [Halomonas sp. MCCC 1A17488]QPP51446.1 FAD-binding oxidoreductase [Halomonas sp. SS10-MC5]
MSRQTVVLGAGMVGVSIAWHLARRGRSVLLVDRRPPGRETSYGNGGLIQREAVRPYTFPREVGKLLSALPNRRVDIRYRVSGMLTYAGPLFDYWRYSSPRHYERIADEYASLIALSTEEHAPMIEAAGAADLIGKEGWLEVHRSQAELERRRREAEDAARRFGVTHVFLDAEGLAGREPGLSADLAGAIHWTNSWSVADPGALVTAYAASFQQQGGEFLQATLERVSPAGQGWHVETDSGSHEADEVVVALGPWAGEWLRRLGYRLPIFVKRGYHMHYGAAEGRRLRHWIADADIGYILAPMRAGIRLTTGAELARIDAPPSRGQLDAAERKARELYPALGGRLEAEPWKGARPCLPDMKPVIGPAPRHKGLWFAFGHGHQGFTMGPVTGRLMAEMMEGEPATVDMSPFRADRF